MPRPLNAEIRARGCLAGIPLGAVAGLMTAFAADDRSGFIFFGTVGAIALLGIGLPYLTIGVLQALGRAIISYFRGS